MDIRLRPFAERDLGFFERFALDRDFSAPFEWGGFTSPEDQLRRWREDRLLGASPWSLAVVEGDDDRAVGEVSWRTAERTGPQVVEIGVLIAPEARGRGVGTAAQRLLVDYLFATIPVHRVWAGTEVENVAEQRALDGCGLRREGLVRGHHFRDGRWRDSYLYGITRDDLDD